MEKLNNFQITKILASEYCFAIKKRVEEMHVRAFSPDFKSPAFCGRLPHFEDQCCLLTACKN